MNHRWEHKGKTASCIRCKIVRDLRTVKTLMATVNHPPWDVYRWQRKWFYITGEAPATATRPECANEQGWRHNVTEQH